jgi:tRNA A-37 threonylcarbamoyl transferase component Bud32
MQAYLKKSSALDEILALALLEPAVRLRPFLGPNGERLWLKRGCDLSARVLPRRRDASRAFFNELKALRVLGKAGLPVPEIVAEGIDHFVLADAGPTLAQVLRSSATPFAKRAAAFRAAGTAIGKLHTTGFAHGKPVIRDICWDGEAARFVDLGQFSGRKGVSLTQAMDMVVFTQSYINEIGAKGPYLDIAWDAYRAAAPASALPRLKRLAFWLLPVAALVAPLRWAMPKAKGYTATRQTLAYLRSLPL